ncbi:MAG: phosphate ABC transporter permease PstA [Halanaeroarchaeum sp.]
MSRDEAGGSEDPIVTETDFVDRLAAVPYVVGLLSFALGWAIVFRWIDVTMPLAGLPLADWLAGLHLLAGVVLVAVGSLSAMGYTDTTPADGAGAGPAFAFGGLAFVLAGLTASQTLGMGNVAWVLAAFVAAVVVSTAVQALPEDLGITLPVGLLEVGIALVVLGRVVGPQWRWHPAGFSATFVGPIAIAVFGLVGGLLSAWAGGAAYREFGSRGRELAAHTLITLNVVALLGILALLIVFVVQQGLEPALEGASLWPPQVPFVTNGYGLRYDVNGIYPAIVGTVWLVVGAVAFSLPLGVGAAVFLTEYAEQGRLTALVEVATNGLWSTPSIVYGLFGYAFLVPRLGNTSSILAGQLVLGFMLLPLVLITSREALQNVPDEYRDASAALGVSQWETIKGVVLPAALPGVLTGVILGVGRIAGETAPILLVLTSEPFLGEGPHVLSSFQFQATPPFIVNEALLSPATALPYQLFAVITAGVGAPESFGWATALVLLLVVLSLYAVGIFTRIYFRRRLNQ